MYSTKKKTRGKRQTALSWCHTAVAQMAVACAAAAIATLLVASCRGKEAKPALRSVYYWSTTLDIDSAKSAFLTGHGIGRMYVRYFDVVPDDAGRNVPNATLRFATPVPHGIDIVPVVFVLPECVRHDGDTLARRIVDRVLQMNAANGITGVGELQIDCDWTTSTRPAYMQFMHTMLTLCHGRGLRLSATIRLHQLAQAPPPADRGVLMFYNTGDVTDPSCRNPILDMRDAAPYLKHLHGYKLPLSVAYPVFSWQVLYRGGRFVGIVHGKDEYPVLPTDSLVTHRPALQDIMEAARAVRQRRGDACRETVLYDLNNKNIRQLKYQDYEKIYNCR